MKVMDPLIGGSGEAVQPSSLQERVTVLGSLFGLCRLGNSITSILYFFVLDYLASISFAPSFVNYDCAIDANIFWFAFRPNHSEMK